MKLFKPKTKTEINGSVDYLSPNEIRGWIHIPNSNKALTASLLKEDINLGSFQCDQLREDVKEAGFGNGFSGFTFSTDTPLFEKTTDLANLNLFLSIGETKIQVTELLSKESLIEVKREETSKRKWFFFPDYRINNHYQTLFYNPFPPTISVGDGNIGNAIEYITQNPSDQVTFHLHWISPIFNSPYLSERESLQKAFLKSLILFKSLGGKTVWTIHNLLSHDIKDNDLRQNEINFRRKLAQHFDNVHLHSDLHLTAIENLYPIKKQKVIVSPHGNFENVFPNKIKPNEARKRLAIPEDSIVFAFIGQIRPYKGLENLFIAFSQLFEDTPQKIYLLVAGKTGHPYSKNYLTDKAALIRNTIVFPEFVADEDLQLYFNACEFIVAPYEEILTSGSVISSLSFNKPVIAPKLGMIEEVIEHEINGILYDSLEEDGLVKAMKKALELNWDKNSLNTKIAQTLKELNWDSISTNFLTKLEVHATSIPKTIELEVDNNVRKVEVLIEKKEELMPSTIGIIILNYENSTDTATLIDSIKDSTYPNYKIIVIDNNSPNETSQSLSNSFSNATVLKTKNNLGYAGGNNIGIAYLKSIGIEKFLIINPDTIIYPNTLKNLIKESANNKDAMHSGVIVKGPNNVSIQFAGARVNKENFGFDFLYQNQPLDSLPNKYIDSDYLNGAFIYFELSLLNKIGFIPEDYFLYYEETDWCLNAKERGVSLYIHPSVKILHNKRSEDQNLPSKHYLYYYIRNTFYFKSNRLGLSFEEIEIDLRNNFIQPWLTKINQRNSNFLPFAKALIESAIKDGKKNLRGRINLEKLYPKNNELVNWQSKGFIDGCKDQEIVGWAINPKDPWKPAKVLFWIDGHPIGSTKANELRPDLKEKGLGNGRFGFRMSIPQKFKTNEKFEISAQFEDSALPISSPKPCVIPRVKSNYEGYIEIPDTYIVIGWAWDKNNPSIDVELILFIDGNEVDYTMANIYREDLKKHKIKNGKAAFKFVLPEKYTKGGKHIFSIKEKNSKTIVFSKEINWKPSVSNLNFRGDSMKDLFNWSFYNNSIPICADNNSFFRIEKILTAYKLSLQLKYKQEKQEDLISVVMPVFNRVSVINVAIDSVLDQHYENWELIIADDGSEDNLENHLIKHYKNLLESKKIKYYKYNTNRGVSAARNLALSKAKGEFIAYLDSDNFWDKNYLNLMVNELRSNPSFSCSYSGQLITNTRNLNAEKSLERAFLRISPFNSSLLENNNYIDLNVFFHRRSLYESCGGFNSSMKRLVDWEYILRLTHKNKPLFVPAILCTYCFGRAENQISFVESFTDSHLKLNDSKLKLSANITREQTKHQFHHVLICSSNSEYDIINQLLALKNTTRNGYLSIIYPSNSTKAKQIEKLFSKDEKTNLISVSEKNGKTEKVILEAFYAAIKNRKNNPIILLQDDVIVSKSLENDLSVNLKESPTIGIGLLKQLVKPTELSKRNLKRVSIGNADFDITFERLANKIIDPLVKSERNIILSEYISNSPTYINSHLIYVLLSLIESETISSIQELIEVASKGIKEGLFLDTAYLPNVFTYDHTYFS